jgi:lipoyl(octanoyl) transferase
MTDTWRLLLDSKPGRGAWNMAVDEAILEAVGRKESLPTLRLFSWQPACLSLGYAQPIQDVDLDKLRDQGWDLVRRLTGGRAVLHVDELTYSVSGPIDEPRLAGTVLESYSRIAVALVKALNNLGLPVQVQEYLPRGNSTTNPVCFQEPSTYEITVQGKKLIGSAQVRRKEGMLQHGALPLFGDLGRITQVLAYTDEPSRDQSRIQLLKHAITVSDALGRQVSWEEAANLLIDAFSNSMNLLLVPGILSEQEITRAMDLEVCKYSSPDWTMRKTT